MAYAELFRVIKMANTMDAAPADSFARIMGTSIAAFAAATYPKKSPNINAPVTQNAALMTLPLGSISVIDSNIGMELTIVRRGPAAEISLIPIFSPTARSG